MNYPSTMVAGWSRLCISAWVNGMIAGRPAKKWSPKDVDAIIDPLDSREVLAFALEVAMQRPRGTPLALETV